MTATRNGSSGAAGASVSTGAAGSWVGAGVGLAHAAASMAIKMRKTNDLNRADIFILLFFMGSSDQYSA
jgi:hypothetical protein